MSTTPAMLMSIAVAIIMRQPSTRIMRTIARLRAPMTMTTRKAHCRGAMRTDRSRRNWPGRAAGAAGSRRSSPSGCGRARGRSSSSLAQGLFWAGVASTFVMGLGTAITVAATATLAVAAKAAAKRFATTRAGYGALALRGLEAGAALLVTAFGVLLLAGLMATERLVGF
jgi:hypothetical protein